MAKSPFGFQIPIKTPQGANNLTSQASYRFRKYYKDVVYPETASPTPIDFWYDVPLYGKIDLDGNAIFLSETNLKQLHTDEGTFFALDFVADAYKDLKNHFKIANMQKAIEFNDENTEMAQINATRGWNSIGKLYHTYMAKVYSTFAENVENSARTRQITNFKDFMNVFKQTALDYTKTMPLTRTAFIISRHSPPSMSGLIVEIFNGDHGSDMRKLDFIKDKNFEFYRNSAKNFGFFVDKNAPWRLVANLQSQKMQQYMQNYGISFSGLFTKYYYKSYESDIATLKQYMLAFYNSFIQSYPITTHVTNSIKEKCKGYTKTKTVVRVPMQDYSELNPAWGIDDNYWLNLYMTLRVVETGANWSKAKFNKAYEKVVTYLSGLGEEAAVKLINDMLISSQNDDIMSRVSYTGVSVTDPAIDPAIKKVPTVPWYLNTKLKVITDENDISNIPATAIFPKEE